MGQNRIHIKLTRRTSKERQADETRRLDFFVRVLKAIHAVAAPETMDVEDLGKQRRGQELLGRLVAPMAGMNWGPFELDDMNCAWVRPHRGHDHHRAILYCHGGGYTSDSLGYSRILTSKLANVTGWQVLPFEYRPASEHPYPAAVENAVRTWDYLMYQGYGARDAVVAGDSAGGNLALVLTYLPKEAGQRLSQALILSPLWAGMTASGKSYQERAAVDPVLIVNYIHIVRDVYARDQDWSDFRLSPLFGDLKDSPPTLIQAGSSELLLSDSIRLRDRLVQAAVPCRLKVWTGLRHVLQISPMKRAIEATESIGRFLLETL